MQTLIVIVAHALPLKEVKTVVRRAQQEILSSTGIYTSATYIRRRVARAPEKDFINFYARHYRYTERTLVIAQARRNEYRQQVSTGMAPICGDKAMVAFIQGTPNAQNMNVITVVHELGHMMGAQHTEDTGSVMDRAPALLAHKNNWKVIFDKKSIDEILECQYK